MEFAQLRAGLFFVLRFSKNGVKPYQGISADIWLTLTATDVDV